jgi:hypothetical protein
VSGPRNRAKAALRARNREQNANVIVGAALARLAEVLTWENFMAAAIEYLWARGWRPVREELRMAGRVARGIFMVERGGKLLHFVAALALEAEAWFQADGAAHAADDEPKPKKTAKRKAGAK